MGFGGMLAGGCAVGAGVSGAAVFTVTSWVSLCTIWASATITHWVVDRAQERAAAVSAAKGTEASSSYASP